MANFLRNIHPLLKRGRREDEHDNTNFAILNALNHELTQTERDTIQSKIHSSLETATGEYLDKWGDWFGVYRRPGQDDEAYRARIIRYLLLKRGTIPAIIDAIKDFLEDYDATVVIYEPWKNIFYTNKSALNGEDHLMGYYYRFAIIDISIDRPFPPEIREIIQAFKPAGVLFYVNYDGSLNPNNKPWLYPSATATVTSKYVTEFLTGITNNVYGKISMSEKSGEDTDSDYFITNDSDLNGADVLAGSFMHNRSYINLASSTMDKTYTPTVGGTLSEIKLGTTELDDPFYMLTREEDGQFARVNIPGFGNTNLLKDSNNVPMVSNNTALYPVITSRVTENGETFLRVKSAPNAKSRDINVYNSIPFSEMTKNIIGKTVTGSYQYRKSASMTRTEAILFASCYHPDAFSPDHRKNLVLRDEWTTAYAVINIPEGTSPSGGVRLALSCRGTVTDEDYIDFRNWKIEEGIVIPPSIWSPSPEDLPEKALKYYQYYTYDIGTILNKQFKTELEEVSGSDYPEVNPEKWKSANISAFRRPDYAEVLAEVKSLNLNTVTVPVLVTATGATDSVPVIDEGSYTYAKGIMSSLASDGYHVILEPYPFINNGLVGETEWNPTDMDLWFSTWDSILGELSVYAQSNNITALYIATNYVHMESFVDKWTTIIDNVRGVFNGKVIYRTNWWVQASWAPETTEAYQAKLNNPVFGLVDIISIASYFEVTDKENPTVAQIKQSMKNVDKYGRGQNIENDIRNFYTKWNKPFLLGELGIPPYSNAASEPWQSEQGAQAYNEDVQSNWFTAWYETFGAYEWFLGFSVFVIGDGYSSYRVSGRKAEKTIRKQDFYTFTTIPEELQTKENYAKLMQNPTISTSMKALVSPTDPLTYEVQIFDFISNTWHTVHTGNLVNKWDKQNVPIQSVIDYLNDNKLLYIRLAFYRKGAPVTLDVDVVNLDFRNKLANKFTITQKMYVYPSVTTVGTLSNVKHNFYSTVITGDYTGSIDQGRLYIDGKYISTGGDFENGKFTYYVRSDLVKRDSVVVMEGWSKTEDIMFDKAPVTLINNTVNFLTNSSYKYSNSFWAFSGVTEYTEDDTEFTDSRVLAVQRTGATGGARAFVTHPLRNLPDKTQPLTFSGYYWVDSTVPLDSASEFFIRASKDGAFIADVLKVPVATNTPVDKWQYFEITTNSIPDYDNLTCCFALTNNGKVKMRRLKLEQGVNAYPWTPTQTVVLRSDFNTPPKVSNSMVENKNDFRYGLSVSTILQPPNAVWGEGEQIHMDGIKKLDGTVASLTRLGVGNIGQWLTKYDAIWIIESNLPTLFAGETTLAQKVQIAKVNISKFQFSIWARGSSPTDLRANHSLYNPSSNSWGASTTSSGTSITQRIITSNNDSTPAYLNPDGMYYFNSYATPSDGVTGSSISIDYSRMEITLATPC